MRIYHSECLCVLMDRWPLRRDGYVTKRQFLWWHGTEGSGSQTPENLRLVHSTRSGVNWTELTCNKLTQLYDALIGHTRVSVTLRNQPHLRGHRYVINKQRCSNNRRNNFLSSRIVNLWNNLPFSTTDFTSFRKFDKSLNNDYIFLLYCKLNFT